MHISATSRTNILHNDTSTNSKSVVQTVMISSSRPEIVVEPLMTHVIVGTAAEAMAGHEAKSDPHIQYLTQSRGDARYATQRYVDDAIAVALSAYWHR